VLVTGANGFIGRALTEDLLATGHSVRLALRSPPERAYEENRALLDAAQANFVIIGNVDGATDWREAVKDIDAVVHLAARVHVAKERAANPLAEYRKVNVAGTERLARVAAEAGVRRFVYISSIGVNGKKTTTAAFREEDLPRPYDPYSISKSEAEQTLWRIAAESDLEVVVLRPPLVYGPDNPGNFRRLMWLIAKGVPLPFSSVRNQRSFIYLGNLTDAILKCVTHPNAPGKTFLVSDGEDISAPELMRALAHDMNCHIRLVSVPINILWIMGKLTGVTGTVEKLTGSLVVDSSKIRTELDWHPPFLMSDGIKKTADWYMETIK
jgi:nucleoside-diphosphate-sugar epimerase